jgi:hypothetical protein
VTFNLYSNGTCTGTPLYTDSNESLSGGSASSATFTTSATGTDYWVATYNGDSNNNAVRSSCSAEPVKVNGATNTTPPSIVDTTSGTSSVADGDILSANPGTWSSPDTLSYLPLKKADSG